MLFYKNKGGVGMKLEEYLIIIGAVFAVIAGLTSITTGKPLITLLTGFTVISGDITPYLGLIGFIGGLVALYGFKKNDKMIIFIGGVLGLLSPCGLSILTIIGSLMMPKPSKK
jgi:hypothetical protein